MPRKKSSIDPKKDPIGYLEAHLVPKALKKLDLLLSAIVPKNHPQYVRSMTIQRAAAGTVINGYVALKQLGIQTQNTDILGQILERIRKHDGLITRADRAQIERIKPTIEGDPVPRGTKPDEGEDGEED